MYSAVEGFTLVDAHIALALNEMAVDQWHVACTANARGHYVSIFPRLVLMLHGAEMNLATSRGAAPAPCTACYVPAGAEIWSRFDAPERFRHVDIHVTQRRLKSLLGVKTLPTEPLFFRGLDRVEPLIDLLADPYRPEDVRERLAECTLLEVMTRHRGNSPDAWLDRLTSHVHANLDRRISVDELALDLGISRAQLTRVMHQRTGSSPYRWVLDLKIGRGKALLEAGYALADVASMTGFSDQAHFNRVFKATTGVSPGLWTKSEGARTSEPIVQDTLSRQI